MGQAVAAVAVGIIKTKELDVAILTKLLDPEDGEWKKGLGKNEPNAHSGMTDRFDVLGFVVALEGHAGSCPDARIGIPDLPLGDVDKVTALIGPKYIAAGRKKWKAFAAFAKRHGVTLPEPTLILTEVEIA